MYRAIFVHIVISIYIKTLCDNVLEDYYTYDHPNIQVYIKLADSNRR